MKAETFYKWAFWTVTGLGLAAVAAVGIALWLFIAPRAFISLRNTTPVPVDVVLLSYRGTTLWRDGELRSIETFSYLRAAETAEVVLVVARPGATGSERHVFPIRQEGHSNCLYRINVRPESVDITKCLMFR